MKMKMLSAILACFCCSLVRGLDHNVTRFNGASGPSRRVLNGDIANPSSYRFAVLLERYLIPCGGTLITNHFILTTAHCLQHQICEKIRIYPSSWKFRDEPHWYAIRCVAHEKYSADNPLYYDIGMVRAADDLAKFPEFDIIPLPAPGSKPAPGTVGIVIGWGVTETNRVSSYLRYGKVLVEDWEICNHKYKNHGRLCTYHEDDLYDADIPRRDLCTQGESPFPAGSCIADFGGGLFINNTLVGISSSTYGTANRDCADGAPTVHVHVADYLPWIYTIIEPERDTRNMKVTPESM